MKKKKNQTKLRDVGFICFFIRLATLELRLGLQSDYKSARNGCTLATDQEISRANPSVMNPGQSYWISGTQLELGCQARGTPTPILPHPWMVEY
jgi:hypothetical protein